MRQVSENGQCASLSFDMSTRLAAGLEPKVTLPSQRIHPTWVGSPALDVAQIRLQ